jgi:hypothetical protein
MAEPLTKALRYNTDYGVEVNVAEIVPPFRCDDKVHDTSLTRGVAHRSCIGQGIL